MLLQLQQNKMWSSKRCKEAVVTVTVKITGTSPYEYSFDGANFSSDSTFKTFTVGPVNAIVKDADVYLLFHGNS
jgi:hypothetical protein